MQPTPTAYPLVSVPSMRGALQQHLQQRARSSSPSGASTPSDEAGGAGDPSPISPSTGHMPPGAWPGTMDDLIRRTLDGDEEGGYVERIAERLAGGRGASRPRGMKRHETAP